MSPKAESENSNGGSRLITKNYQVRDCGEGIFELQGSAS